MPNGDSKPHRSVVYLFLMAVLLALNGCSRQQAKSTVAVDGQHFTIETVCSRAERQYGLSGRAYLPEGQGMLFIFETPYRHGIWMKDMHFPIDIIWIDEFRTVIDIKAAATPDSYPTVFVPSTPALYVLEIPAGSGIRPGALVTMNDAYLKPPGCR